MGYIIQDDILYHISPPVKRDTEPRLQVAIPSSIQKSVMKEPHSTDYSGHVSVEKTYDRIRTRFHWPNMYKDIVDYVHKCDVYRSRHMKPFKAPMQDMPIPSFPFR